VMSWKKSMKLLKTNQLYEKQDKDFYC